MIRPSFRLLACSCLLLPAWHCGAGVTVIENVSPGATNWPGSPLLSTLSNPASQATVGESFNGGTGNTNLSQTFTISGTTNYTLQTIDLYAGTGSGTGAGTNVVLRLYDLGAQTAPNPSPYTAGTDLFNSGGGLSITYTTQVSGVLQFNFTGADQATLQAGHMYAFEINGGINTTPIFWQRSISNTFAGGAAYRNRSWINATNGRDFALAVYVNASGSDSNPPSPSQCVVDWNELHQPIDGFGGGVQFLNPASLDPVPASVMDTLYGAANSNQLGLTLLRIGIDPNGSWSNQLQDAQKAYARGAGILATPWTPPSTMKTPQTNAGGILTPSQYTNYAYYLNGFAAFMASNGAPLRAISIQNEPDVRVNYDSCNWSAAQLQTFCRDAAGLITNAPVVMPESFQYDQSMSDPTLNDPLAATNVSIIGEHLYGNGDAGVPVVSYPNAHDKGKAMWMTEFLVNDQTLATALTTAEQIHQCLTIGNFSAYIWWKCYGDANGLVSASGVPQIRGFVMAQYSRFVHTNYYRIGANYATNAEVTAFKDPAGTGFAFVAINSNIFSVNETFTLTNFTATSVTPWVTSGSLSLAVQSAVTVSNSSFTYTLPAQSVVTFVGQAALPVSNSAPSLLPVGDQVVNAGVVLLITNTATDPDLPAQTLTFGLLNGPTNATLTTLNASNALFSWRPLVSQAGTTNAIVITVADNGTPDLSATNSFKVTVNSLAQPSMSAIALLPGQVNLTITGPVGPDYTLWTSTNLMDWQAAFTTNSPVTPFVLTDTNRTDAARFYRVQLVP
jgi:glucuronoarabinoxylan endo-1,4-beta-xylanase